MAAWISSTRNAVTVASLKQALNPTRVPHELRRSISIQQLDIQGQSRERIIILGSGWAGYSLSRDLDSRKYQVVVVSPRSYFVFTPLLAETSVGTLEFRTALEPVRSRRSKAHFFQGWADAVDFDSRTLTVEEAVEDPKHVDNAVEDKSKGQLFDLKYDKLVIAVGCYNQTFNTKGVKENAYFLRDVGDARKIRNRLLSCFETAALPTTSEETRKQLLNFAVVGGGPTGIEWSAELYDFINEDMKRLYPDLVSSAKITVYDVAPQVLSMFDNRLAEYAIKQFKREGISVRTSHHVKELRAGAPGAIGQQSTGDAMSPYTIKLKEEGEIGVGMCVWSTGLMMNPFVEKALADGVKRDSKSGGIVTNARLQVQTSDGSAISDVYALGDCAVQEDTAYPATAQVASQKAIWLAKRFNKGDVEQHSFSWKNMGTMAYIGNQNAIVQSQGGNISGRVAWFIWRSAYLAKSLSWRNRILISVYWRVRQLGLWQRCVEILNEIAIAVLDTRAIEIGCQYGGVLQLTTPRQASNVMFWN